uniref:Uncharacterized protein n=1 Tax=Arundo donax TaxID=35708 RepID=A0A0A8YCZ1_ARUDO
MHVEPKRVSCQAPPAMSCVATQSSAARPQHRSRTRSLHCQFAPPAPSTTAPRQIQSVGEGVEEAHRLRGRGR